MVSHGRHLQSMQSRSIRTLSPSTSTNEWQMSGEVLSDRDGFVSWLQIGCIKSQHVQTCKNKAQQAHTPVHSSRVGQQARIHTDRCALLLQLLPVGSRFDTVRRSLRKPSSKPPISNMWYYDTLPYSCSTWLLSILHGNAKSIKCTAPGKLVSRSLAMATH